MEDTVSGWCVLVVYLHPYKMTDELYIIVLHQSITQSKIYVESLRMDQDQASSSAVKRGVPAGTQTPGAGGNSPGGIQNINHFFKTWMY